MRRVHLVIAGAALAAVLVAGLLVWRPWTADADPCTAALTQTDRLPAATQLDALAEPDQARILTEPGAPFGPQRVAVPEPESPRLAVGGTVVQQSSSGLVGALDARTGEQVWAFEQNGTGYGATQVGGGMVLVQHPDGSRATAVAVGIEDGQVRNCTTFGADEPVAGTGTAVTVAQRTVALLRREERADPTATLSMIDPTRGEPLWTRDVELPRSVTYGYQAGGVVVFGAAGTDPTSAWQLAVDERDIYTPEDRRLYAFAADDGAPLWDYAHEDFAGQVIGTGFDIVVVRATRLEEGGKVLRNRLIALDERTGEENWSVDLPNSTATYYEQGTLFGDVLVVSESDPKRGAFADLVGRDLYTGEELWRIDNRITGLERAGLVGNLALIPGKSLAGLELVHVRTGESRTVFDGLSVLSASADGTSIGIEAILGRDRVLVTYDRES
ncbi:PQQ-binding-like beta-propeller repeat protein [Actinophytocola sp.]|uniref:outer membrane protein assembly factor BamB family protein n=1 Tax=Actinophytocola sp. TaxID=1872138 RepID=UPI003D6C661B